MEDTKNAIQAAYAAQISNLYNKFAQALLNAGEHRQKIKNSEARFLKGLKHANDVRERAFTLIDS